MWPIDRHTEVTEHSVAAQNWKSTSFHIYWSKKVGLHSLTQQMKTRQRVEKMTTLRFKKKNHCVTVALLSFMICHFEIFAIYIIVTRTFCVEVMRPYSKKVRTSYCLLFVLFVVSIFVFCYCLLHFVLLVKQTNDHLLLSSLENDTVCGREPLALRTSYHRQLTTHVNMSLSVLVQCLSSL